MRCRPYITVFIAWLTLDTPHKSTRFDDWPTLDSLLQYTVSLYTFGTLISRWGLFLVFHYTLRTMLFPIAFR